MTSSIACTRTISIGSRTSTSLRSTATNSKAFSTLLLSLVLLVTRASNKQALPLSCVPPSTVTSRRSTVGSASSLGCLAGIFNFVAVKLGSEVEEEEEDDDDEDDDV